jgi:hypothetical protein
MIDRKIFNREMNVLAERFNRDITADVGNGYYEILNKELAQGEFRDGCKYVFRHSRFFPSPQEIIEAVRGSNETRAEAEWAELIAALKANRRAELTKVGRRAYDSIGSDWAMKTDSTAHLRREFLRAYLALAVSDETLEGIFDEAREENLEEAEHVAAS